MHQHFWRDDDERKEVARKLEADLREAAAKRAAGMTGDTKPPTHPPRSGESYVTRTSTTAIKLINVLLDDWRSFASEIPVLTREAHDLHQIESGADIEF